MQGSQFSSKFGGVRGASSGAGGITSALGQETGQKSGDEAPSKRLTDAAFAQALAAQGLPRRFGHLTLLRQIARGGMGEVFLATSGAIEGAERPCVVKIIRRDHAGDRSFLARFLDEARIQAQLQHPGVAQVVEAAKSADGNPYVVVEYVEGRNLGEVRTRAIQLKLEISWADAVAVAVTLCDALAHVHERTDAAGNPLGIVHRDLSPQNVMVGYQGDLKLIDFGTARGENRRCQTVAGIVFAKPGYVAPEVANETPGGIPADIYAVGVILWELVAGRRFLQGEPSEHLAQVAAGKRNPPALAEELGVPRELDAIIARMTAPALMDRYASARAAVVDLIRLLKKAPSLAGGDTSVRSRIAHLMFRLYPAEPAKSRAEFARLVAVMRKAPVLPPAMPASPAPAQVTKPKSEALKRDIAQLAQVADEAVRSVGQSPLKQHSCVVVEGSESAPSEPAPGGPLEKNFLAEKGEPLNEAVAEPPRLSPIKLVPEAEAIREADAANQGASQPSERGCLPGTRYRIVRLISSGEMGEVFEAEHLDLNRKVALKVLPSGKLSEVQLRRFSEEAKACASLRQENLVTLYDYGVAQDGRPFYVMELLEGETLKELLEREGTIGWRQAARMASQACLGLAAAHAAGIIHRDIKPGNLFLTRDGDIKLLDFGVAGLAVGQPEMDEALRLIGTPEYMAPEQIRGEADLRSDIYALGAVLYQLTSGQLPHVANTTVALLHQKLRVMPESLRERAPTRGLPIMFDNTVQKSLSSEPEKRYQSADELRQALESALNEPAKKQKRRRAIGAGLVAVLGLLVAGAAVFGASKPELRNQLLSAVGYQAQASAPAEAAAEAESDELMPEAQLEMAQGESPDSVEMGDQVDAPEGLDEATDEAAELAKVEAEADAEENSAEKNTEAGAGEATAELKADADPVAAPPEAATPVSLQAKSVSKDAAVLDQLAQAQELMARGQRIKGFNQIRRIGRNNRKNAEVLKAWSEAAANMRAWGEAHRVAVQWAELSSDAEARIHLARMQRAVGKRDAAIQTLANLLKDQPNSAEAKQLLQMYGGKQAIALR